MEKALPAAKKAPAEAVAGFRAWFILQHYYGCHPFMTKMEKTFSNVE